MRRKAEANCYVGKEFVDPVANYVDCPCSDEDYEWYILDQFSD
jgi:hypothetical protein